MPKMRAKMKVAEIFKGEGFERLSLSAVCKSEGYDETGNDENNTFAKWTPSADCNLHINNPELHGQFKVGQEFYVDFIEAK